MTSGVWREGKILNQSIGQWSKEAWLSNEVSLQTHELMGQLLVWWTCGNSRRLVSLKMAWKLCAPCHLSCPMHFFHLNYNSCPLPPSVVSFYAISVQFSHSVMSDSGQPHALQHYQPSLSISKSQSLLKLKPITSVMPSNHPILCCFSYLWSTTVWKY